MNIEEMIKVMEHCRDGGEVEIRLENNNRDNWTPTSNPSWNWSIYDYRIKELKQKVTIEKWLCLDNHGDYEIIESSNVNKYKLYEKVKLLESYEVEIIGEQIGKRSN